MPRFFSILALLLFSLQLFGVAAFLDPSATSSMISKHRTISRRVAIGGGVEEGGGEAAGGGGGAAAAAAAAAGESEEERLRLDQLARDTMAAHMASDSLETYRRSWGVRILQVWNNLDYEVDGWPGIEGGLYKASVTAKVEAAEGDAGEGAQDRAAWKWAIRKRIWDMMEATDIAEFPRPVHHRIPNFKGAEAANEQLARLPEFQGASCVKVNPDTPQKQIRFITLNSGKTLLVPQPRLRTGFFSRLLKSNIPAPQLQKACTQAGVKDFGEAIGFDQPLPKVDLVVVGSAAVDPRSGARLGKGEGFAELEYGILRMMGVIDENTPVVTSIHDEQILEPGEINTSKMLRHDVPVDIICTPTQVIRTDRSIPKPTGIYWDLLSPEKLASIKVLQHLKRKIEAETGQKLPEGQSEILPPVAFRGERAPRGGGAGGGGSASARRGGRAVDGGRAQEGIRRDFDLFVTNLPYKASTKDLQEHFSSAGRVEEVKLLQGKSKGKAFIKLVDSGEVEQFISTLNGVEFQGDRKLYVRKFK